MREPATGARESMRDFFDAQESTGQYRSLKKQSEALDLFCARYLNDEVRGHVLTVGGLWEHFEWRPHVESLTVLDMSERMLKAYCPERAIGIIGDLYSHEFEPGTFDAVVYPHLLHHTPLGNWRSCERRFADAIERARQWLKPSGSLFIVDCCPHPVLYRLERLLLPLTRRFLNAVGQPLVIMYERPFYERVLQERFQRVDALPVEPPGFNWWAWYPVFMSMRWPRVPWAVFPKMYVFTATAPRPDGRS
jgi:hypothetical protein